jgi:hypothetical protein
MLQKFILIILFINLLNLNPFVLLLLFRAHALTRNPAREKSTIKITIKISSYGFRARTLTRNPAREKSKIKITIKIKIMIKITIKILRFHHTL